MVVTIVFETVQDFYANVFKMLISHTADYMHILYLHVVWYTHLNITDL